ncbi:porin family protein [Dyadobacter sp. LHD-138]|uniref:type IX secretion/gliding motility protein PorT/SprT n=1 Tax=Dyadobacter sp. LHD-138 TaxID=3071413 RepID=UPI0027DF9E4C|nr:porin family protein [Dyadobacter sp. LHD-138]MDQ6482147.1 porin family protein [Dyadobacter sp. LHD-138]
MHTINLRDLLHLHRAKIIIGILFLCVISQEVKAQGQGYVRRHLEYYDDKPIHYGILFAMPLAKYNIRRSEAFASDTAYLIQSPLKGAFRMGFIINAYLNERFDIRTTPSVSLYEREVKYSYPNSVDKTDKRESTWLEIPLLVKYKSKRRVNTRMYMIAGVTMGIETNVKRSRGGTGSNGRLDTQTSDFTLDYGVGYERFFEFFKFSPELRFSHGLKNVFQGAPSSGISRLTSHTVTLYLNFE